MIWMLDNDLKNGNIKDEYYTVFYKELLTDIIKYASTIKIDKKCCVKTAQEIYEYEGLIVK